MNLLSWVVIWVITILAVAGLIWRGLAALQPGNSGAVFCFAAALCTVVCVTVFYLNRPEIARGPSPQKEKRQ